MAIDIQSAKISLGDTGYPASHNAMIDTVETGCNEAISTAEAASNAAWTATSATSLLIAVASKVFTLAEIDRAFTIGSPIKASSTANPNNYMTGVVTAYSGTTLTVDVTAIGGSGTLAAWSITVTPVGALTDIIQDASPQLGGDLDCNGNMITGSSYAQIADATPATGTTHTFNYSSGDMQQITCPAAGTLTLAVSNFPSGILPNPLFSTLSFSSWKTKGIPERAL